MSTIKLARILSSRSSINGIALSEEMSEMILFSLGKTFISFSPILVKQTLMYASNFVIDAERRAEGSPYWLIDGLSFKSTEMLLARRRSRDVDDTVVGVSVA